MAWQKFDFLDVEKAIFASEIKDVILPMYRVGVDRISDRKKQIQERFEKAMSQAKTESDETDARGQASYEETRCDEQLQAIGSLALHHLCTALKVALIDATRFFAESHPRSAEGYPGKSWLGRLQDEYNKRFDIDFENAPVPLANIEELALARNAGLHWDGEAIREYEHKVLKPRFLHWGIVQVSPAEFDKAISEAESFVNWVIDQLKQLRAKKQV